MGDSDGDQRGACEDQDPSRGRQEPGWALGRKTPERDPLDRPLPPPRQQVAATEHEPENTDGGETQELLLHLDGVHAGNATARLRR